MKMKLIPWFAMALVAVMNTTFAAPPDMLAVNETDRTVKVTLHYDTSHPERYHIEANRNRLIAPLLVPYQVSVCWISWTRANHCIGKVLACSMNSPTHVKLTGSYQSGKGELHLVCGTLS